MAQSAGRGCLQDRRTWFAAGFAAVAVAVAAPAEAQSVSSTMTLSARVRQTITVTPQRNLDFGSVVSGVPKTVAVSDATAGRFRVRGENGAAVLLSFTLPVNLVSGANLLPIGTWTGYWNQSAATNGGTAFTPSSGPTAATLSNGAGQLFVYIGGQVSPAVNQPGGLYSATITLTVDYP